MYLKIIFLFCLLEGILIAKFGWTALLWSPLGFVVGLFASANIVLPILMGVPMAISHTSKNEMRPRVFLALVRTPLIWTTAIFLFAWFLPSATNWIIKNETFTIGLICGAVAIILSPLSKKSRIDFRTDFNKSYSSYYTSANTFDNKDLALLLYKTGFDALDKNKYSEAADSFSKAITIFKELPKTDETDRLLRELFFNRGHSKDELKDYAGAIQDYNLAIEYGGNEVDEAEFVNRALAKFELGYYDDAINDYDKVIQINSANARAYFGRGNAKYQNRDKDKACIDWKEAERLGFSYASEILEVYCSKQ